MTQQIMTTYEGAALRVQLEAMVKVIEPYESAAKEASDIMLLSLLGQLRQAHTTAAQIEERPPLEKGGVPLTRN